MTSTVNLGFPGDFVGACMACGEASALRIDHIYKFSPVDPELNLNLELLCATCSTDKNARTSQEWIATLVQRFAGDGVDPAIGDCAPESCKVFFPVAADDVPAAWPRNVEGEVLWAQRRGPRSAQILNTPFTVRDLTLLDVVNLKECSVPEGVTDSHAADHYFRFDSVAERSGYGTLRVTFDEPTLDFVDEVLGETSGFSYSRETGGGACTIAVPQQFPLQDVALALKGSTFPGFSIEVLSSPR